jgi:hypothetical protein
MTLALKNGDFDNLKRIKYTPNSRTALPTGVSLKTLASGSEQITLTFVNTPVPLTDAGASGAGGGIRIYGFQQGNVVIDNFRVNLTTARLGTNLTATAALVASLGTVAAAADATLTTTEADIASSTVATLTAGAGTFTKIATAPVYIDGTSAAKDVYLNFAVPDAGSAGNDSVVVNGTITIIYSNTTVV